MKKTLLALSVAAAIALFFGTGFDQYLTLGALKENQGEFAAMLEQHPWRVTLAAFALYVVVVALSLPFAAIMTLAMGALFGFWYGTLLVSFASTLGATLAFLTSRYLLRDFVRQRFGDRLKAVDEGVAKDGALYLFMMRLAPVFPFLLVNLLMGLTPIRMRTFYWISQMGMLAGTMVYVNAGTQLARLDSLSGIVAPGMLLSLVLLGAFPLVVKRVDQAIQGRHARFQ